MPEATSPPPRYGAPSRGITARDVELAADALLRAGERPTIERIREKIGRGSPNTINPLLDTWWKRLAARLDAGPAAFRRLPDTVAHVAEALWMQALDEARRRAEQELNREARTAAKLEQDLEVRSHVLTLREGELQTRLEARDRDVDELRLQVRGFELRARKDQATIHAQAARLSDLENQLLARIPTRRLISTPKTPTTPKNTASRKRAGKLRRPANSSERSLKAPTRHTRAPKKSSSS